MRATSNACGKRRRPGGLSANWAKYPAPDRATCADTARLGTPSYVEMLTCLQMDADLRAMKYKPK